ncbi:hypothetical protein [Sphingobacterium psychroaquaticum]|uniref:Uncharacterized protein n=1 Tax=Sphingobacterium psychroaquaticum TaxID=561061 RepID=A0A1X7JUY3_9SPHI|nr:hypothetical protein [Sphingobacterium psychroaquaticum]SMG32198.1 hypothetical protein SAMN05660862_2237 [Sphingobacterium psychroaquaticum]
MANENKNEKAGATTPATPSTVEGTQSTDQAQLDLAPNTSNDEVEKLKAELVAKDSEIESLKAEHKAFKEKLKPEIEKIQSENEKLKAELVAKDSEIESLKAEHKAFKEKLKPEIEKIQSENEKLKAELAKTGKQSKASKSGAAKFVVVSAFRGNQKGEGIFEIDSDVSHFDADRLKDLVSRELVKEVK